MSAKADGLRDPRTLRFDRATPHELRIETVVTRTGPGASLSTRGDFTMNPNASLRPFLATIGAPEQSLGFRHMGAPFSCGSHRRSRGAVTSRPRASMDGHLSLRRNILRRCVRSRFALIRG